MFPRTCHLTATLVVLALARTTAAGPPAAPPLPEPTGRVVHVSTEPELQQAVRGLTSDTTIMIAPGTYRLTGTLHVSGSLRNVMVRGASDDRNDVILLGPGMTAAPSSVPSGIWTGGDVQGVTIANLTVEGFPFHCIILNGGTELPYLYNVRLADAGQQIVKSNPDGAGGGVDGGIVEYSVIEFATTSRDWYTNGVDVLGGRDWTIRHNLFRNIRAPAGRQAGPAVLMWRGAQGTVTEGNTFIDCQRAIAYGLERTTPYDHRGGIIRNNFIYRRPTQPGDAGIGVWASPGTVVAHNTVVLSGTYLAAIEYRFPEASGIQIINNLTDALIQQREGATATVQANYTQATVGLFENADAGDLHLNDTSALFLQAGIDTGAAPYDWDDDPRPQGSQREIGADEVPETGSESEEPPEPLTTRSGGSGR